ncbi:vanadium-dependent haloperoxidase [Segetibacter sp. 3557_3]|uniref:vanadium-dependent haloperoxidase n=1 Tax=Segetibacter sp. 3557_3 TaxID=2547429 RepID=UPI0014053209|nr:vanadium-dependent haloperoxidase [Segetibacter sp. 3557_3]
MSRTQEMYSVIEAGSTNTPTPKKADPKSLTDQNLLHENFDQLTAITAIGKFSPPLASRIYSYTSLASYEAFRFQKPGARSLVKDLKGFPQMPLPDKNRKYDYLLAATKAFFTVAKQITLAKDTITSYEGKVYGAFKNLLRNDIFENSMQFGELVGNAVLKRASMDKYDETRARPKLVESQEPGKWRRTPAGYLSALEPYWGQILPLALDSAAEIKAPLPPPYSLEKNSAFYRAATEVYEIGVTLTEERKMIAKYWDDNPLVKDSADKEFGSKKITPVAHWIGIAGIACKMKNFSAMEILKTYAITSVAMHDAIITSWSQKYLHNVIRPVTVINEFIDSNWHSFLQTPPTPEHSSGHSSISAAAATILTYTFGENFAFEDTSDLAYIGMRRRFSSFNSAAQEVSISRVYGGIHYRTGIEAGVTQGRAVGEYVIRKLLKASAKQKL